MQELFDNLSLLLNIDHDKAMQLATLLFIGQADSLKLSIKQLGIKGYQQQIKSISWQPVLEFQIQNIQNM